ncbi:MAG: hypothetical protein Alpg2KO_29390 [Alphaproteobacteria bacterium]
MTEQATGTDMQDWELVVEQDETATRAALLDDKGRLQGIEIDRADMPHGYGAVLVGRVVGEGPAGLGVLVEIGKDTRVFLPEGDFIPRGERPVMGTLIPISLRADAGSGKRFTATMDIVLEGNGLIHVPTDKRIAASRRMSNKQLVTALKEALGKIGGGWVIRGRAEGRKVLDLIEEAQQLATQWADLQDRIAAAKAPSLIRPGPDPVERILGGLDAKPGRAMIRANADLTARIGGQLGEGCLIDHVGSGDSPFDLRDLDQQIEGLLCPFVHLPSGGDIMIEETSALIAIDVNSGANSNGVEVNIEAATEVARQLRLRNLGGIVMVDFLKTRNRKRINVAIDALRDGVSTDPCPVYLHGMTSLGLMEMTRARRGWRLADLVDVSAPDHAAGKS